LEPAIAIAAPATTEMALDRIEEVLGLRPATVLWQQIRDPWGALPPHVLVIPVAQQRYDPL
jgi:hypothetical protein